VTIDVALPRVASGTRSVRTPSRVGNRLGACRARASLAAPPPRWTPPRPPRSRWRPRSREQQDRAGRRAPRPPAGQPGCCLTAAKTSGPAAAGRRAGVQDALEVPRAPALVAVLHRERECPQGEPAGGTCRAPCRLRCDRTVRRWPSRMSAAGRPGGTRRSRWRRHQSWERAVPPGRPARRRPAPRPRGPAVFRRSHGSNPAGSRWLGARRPANGPAARRERGRHRDPVVGAASTVAVGC